MTRVVACVGAAVMLLAAMLRADVRLPQYSREVLPNGLVVNIMPRRDVPLATIRVVVRGGQESDPAGMAGLSSVTAEALRRGSRARTADQFSQELDELGATLSAGADFQSSVVQAELLSKDFDKGLSLVSGAILQPTFPEAEIRKMLAQRIDAAKALKDNPGPAAGLYFSSFFFGSSHPYGQPSDEIEIARIRRDDIVAYHKRMYTGRNMVVVVAGDVDPARISASIAKAFGTTPPGEAWQWKKVPGLTIPATKVLIVDKPDATQTELLIGVPGIERTNPDRVAVWLVNTIFGGRFTSILNDELRVNSGLTYGANSRFDRARLAGRITITTFTATENTGKTLDVALQLLRMLGKQGITAEQLASAKAYVKGIYPTQSLETSDQLAQILSDMEIFDLNRGEVDDLFSRIDAVTLERANQVARKYFGSANFTILLLGNAEKIRPAASTYDPEPLVVPVSRPGIRVPQL